MEKDNKALKINIKPIETSIDVLSEKDINIAEDEAKIILNKINNAKQKSILILKYPQIQKKFGDLSIQEIKFCQIYTSHIEFFGNGIQSYIITYKPDMTKRTWYNRARYASRVLLKNRAVLAYINALLEDLCLNEVAVDKQLAFLISQNSDFGTKLGAIREFNALKGRAITKLDLSIADHRIAALSEKAAGLVKKFAHQDEPRNNDKTTKSGENIEINAEYQVLETPKEGVNTTSHPEKDGK